MKSLFQAEDKGWKILVSPVCLVPSLSRVLTQGLLGRRVSCNVGCRQGGAAQAPPPTFLEEAEQCGLGQKTLEGSVA